GGGGGGNSRGKGGAGAQQESAAANRIVLAGLCFIGHGSPLLAGRSSISDAAMCVERLCGLMRLADFWLARGPQPASCTGSHLAVDPYDCQKFVRLEACAADQRPIDLGNTHQFLGVRRLDRSA